MIRLVHPHTKQFMYVPVGASITNWFFGPAVALYRGEGGYFWLYTLFNMLTFWIYQIVMIFKFNKGYIQRKFQQGWIPAKKNDKEILLAYGGIPIQSAEEMGLDDDFNIPFKPNRVGFYIYIVVIVLFWIAYAFGIATLLAVVASESY